MAEGAKEDGELIGTKVAFCRGPRINTCTI